MDLPLPGASALLADAWRMYRRDLRHTFEVSIWLVAPGLLLLGGALAAGKVPEMWHDPIFYASFLAYLLATVAIAFRLTDFILRRTKDATLSPQAISWPTPKRFGSFLWVELLEGLAVAGGLVLLFFPGVWVGILLMFGRYLYLDENRRGLQALTTSIALVKGRWWSIFTKSLFAGILFTIALSIATFFVSTLVGVVAGFDRVDALVSPAVVTPMSQALSAMIQSVAQVALAPLLITWQVLLYRAAQDTRKSS